MSIEVRTNVPLGPLTTFGIGGPSRYYIPVSTETELEEAASYIKRLGLPFMVVGGGSNILVKTSGFAGVVIHMLITGRHYDVNDDGSVLATIGAGETLDDLIEDTVSKQWWGLENLSAIPGTVGATPIQNVGAYGREVGDLITFVRVLDIDTMSYRTLVNADCLFGYRDSIFKQAASKKFIVTQVQFKLSLKPTPLLQYPDLQKIFSNRIPTLFEIRQAVIATRKNKFPDWSQIGTAGSFFKNPIVSDEQAELLLNDYKELPVYDFEPGYKKVSLAYILDKVCNLKGFSQNGVALYEKQALVLVATRQCTAEQIIDFSEYIMSVVKEKTNITLEREVQLVGE